MVSINELLIKLQSPDLGTDELHTTINTLLTFRNEISKIPSLGLKLSSILLAVLCDNSKWILMDKDLKYSASQLLATDISLSYIVTRLKLGFQKLSDASLDKGLSSSMELSLNLAGTYVTKKELQESTTGTSATIQTINEHDSFIIKPEQSSAYTNNAPEENIQVIPLSLEISKPIVVIQFDILLWILDHQHLKPLIYGFYEEGSTHYETKKRFKSLLASKIPELLGNGLVILIDSPEALSISKLSITKDRVKGTIDLYASALLSTIFAIANESDNMLSMELICELWRHDSTVFSLLLSYWMEFISFVPNLSTSLRTSKVETDLLKDITKRLFKSIDGRLNNINFKEYYVIIDSWVAKLETSGVKKRVICDLVYNLCEASVSEFSIFNWLTAINYIDSKWVMKALSKFGSKDYISGTPQRTQKQFTILIVFMLKQLDLSELSEISKNPIFLNSITAHLESKLEDVREFGMFVADQIYELENKKPLFLIQKHIDLRVNFLRSLDDFIKFESDGSKIDVQSATKELLKKEPNKLLMQPSNASIETEKPLILKLDYDSDADDSDAEDTSIPRKPRIAKPAYLKDLLAYLTCDNEKDNKAYYKKGTAFSIGIEMVRIKANTAEIVYYTKALIDSVSSLNDFGFPNLPKANFSETSRLEAFNIWKMSFMIAIVVSSPSVAIDHLLKCFLQNDISTPYRVQILSAIGFACRELCNQGQNDTFIWGKENQQKVAPKQLNGPGHDQFMKLEYQSAECLSGKRNKTKNTSDDSNIKIGMVTKRSKKLEIDEKSTKSSQELQAKKKVTTYINKNLPKLFFALSSIWHEVSSQTGGKGFNIGSMSEILNGHYLSIMALVYVCGVPSCIELIDMSKELLTIAREQLLLIEVTRHNAFLHLLFAGAIKCVSSVVLENDLSLSILVNDMPLELVEIMGLVTSIMNEHEEVLSDPVTVSKAAKIVLKLQELFKI